MRWALLVPAQSRRSWSVHQSLHDGLVAWNDDCRPRGIHGLFYEAPHCQGTNHWGHSDEKCVFCLERRPQILTSSSSCMKVLCHICLDEDDGWDVFQINGGAVETFGTHIRHWDTSLWVSGMIKKNGVDFVSSQLFIPPKHCFPSHMAKELYYPNATRSIFGQDISGLWCHWVRIHFQIHMRSPMLRGVIPDALSALSSTRQAAARYRIMRAWRRRGSVNCRRITKK